MGQSAKTASRITTSPYKRNRGTAESVRAYVQLCLSLSGVASLHPNPCWPFQRAGHRAEVIKERTCISREGIATHEPGQSFLQVFGIGPRGAWRGQDSATTTSAGRVRWTVDGVRLRRCPELRESSQPDGLGTGIEFTYCARSQRGPLDGEGYGL